MYAIEGAVGFFAIFTNMSFVCETNFDRSVCTDCCFSVYGRIHVRYNCVGFHLSTVQVVCTPSVCSCVGIRTDDICVVGGAV